MIKYSELLIYMIMVTIVFTLNTQNASHNSLLVDMNKHPAAEYVFKKKSEGNLQKKVF